MAKRTKAKWQSIDLNQLPGIEVQAQLPAPPKQASSSQQLSKQFPMQPSASKPLYASRKLVLSCKLQQSPEQSFEVERIPSPSLEWRAEGIPSPSALEEQVEGVPSQLAIQELRETGEDEALTLEARGATSLQELDLIQKMKARGAATPPQALGEPDENEALILGIRNPTSLQELDLIQKRQGDYERSLSRSAASSYAAADEEPALELQVEGAPNPNSSSFDQQSPIEQTQSSAASDQSSDSWSLKQFYPHQFCYPLASNLDALPAIEGSKPKGLWHMTQPQVEGQCGLGETLAAIVISRDEIMNIRGESEKMMKLSNKTQLSFYFTATGNSSALKAMTNLSGWKSAFKDGYWIKVTKSNFNYFCDLGKQTQNQSYSNQWYLCDNIEDDIIQRQEDYIKILESSVSANAAKIQWELHLSITLLKTTTQQARYFRSTENYDALKFLSDETLVTEFNAAYPRGYPVIGNFTEQQALIHTLSYSSYGLYSTLLKIKDSEINDYTRYSEAYLNNLLHNPKVAASLATKSLCAPLNTMPQNEIRILRLRDQNALDKYLKFIGLNDQRDFFYDKTFAQKILSQRPMGYIVPINKCQYKAVSEAIYFGYEEQSKLLWIELFEHNTRFIRWFANQSQSILQIIRGGLHHQSDIVIRDDVRAFGIKGADAQRNYFKHIGRYDIVDLLDQQSWIKIFITISTWLKGFVIAVKEREYYALLTKLEYDISKMSKWQELPILTKNLETNLVLQEHIVRALLDNATLFARPQQTTLNASATPFQSMTSSTSYAEDDEVESHINASSRLNASATPFQSMTSSTSYAEDDEVEPHISTLSAPFDEAAAEALLPQIEDSASASAAASYENIIQHPGIACAGLSGGSNEFWEDDGFAYSDD